MRLCLLVVDWCSFVTTVGQIRLGFGFVYKIGLLAGICNAIVGVGGFGSFVLADLPLLTFRNEYVF